MIGPPLTASKQRTFSVEGIGPLPRSIVDTTRGDHDDLSREDVRLGCLGHGVLLEAVMFRKKHGHGCCRADEFHKCRVKLPSPKVGRNDDAWAFCTDWLCAWASCIGGRSTAHFASAGVLAARFVPAGPHFGSFACASPLVHHGRARRVGAFA